LTWLGVYWGMSSIFREIASPRVIWLKASLFLVAGVGASALLLVDRWNWRTALLLCIAVWSFCRLYYFVFYALERYVDPEFRFAGLIALVRHRLGRR